MNRTKLAIAAAVGAVSLAAISAVAQQPTTSPAANPPASGAPAAQQPATPPAVSEKAPAPTAKRDEPGERREGWRRHHRGEYGRGARGGRSARRGDRGGFVPRMGRRWRNMSDADRKAFFEARIAAIRAGLMLNEAQARLWGPVENAVRGMINGRRAWRDRVSKEGRPANPMDRLKRRGEFLSERGAALQKLAAAGKPLYDSLDDDQKRRLRILTRGHRFGAGRRGMRRGGRYHRGGHHHWREGRRDRRNWGGARRWRQNLSGSEGFDRGNGMADWRRL